MLFEHYTPSASLSDLVKEYWIFENDDPTIYRQKIIPDGYGEIIIHYGDPYRINFGDDWEIQSKMLYSNQISGYFFLENTGKSGMIGIKLHPCSFFELFGIPQSPYVDQVVPLTELLALESNKLTALHSDDLSPKDRVKRSEEWLLGFAPTTQTKVRSAVDKIMDSRGIVDIDEIAEEVGLSTRQLERQFKNVVGLTPKFYSRIIRFSSIFKVMESDDPSWVKVALQSGYFDQSHFIKNFKEFTGEEPSKYGFDEQNLANFFLR